MEMSNNTLFRMAYAKRIFNRHGMAGIYRGAGATICRDAPACGIYFCGNSYFLKQLNYRRGLKIHNM